MEILPAERSGVAGESLIAWPASEGEERAMVEAAIVVKVLQKRFVTE